MKNKSYADFLSEKAVANIPTGIDVSKIKINKSLFGFQKTLVKWALRRGRAALFCGCGMGKTIMQLEWADHIPGNTLILAPLSVAPQTVREGEKFDIKVRYCRDQSKVEPGITVTNYEMMAKFDPSYFSAIVLDESSCLKSYDSQVRQDIIDSFKDTPFKLACTATPAPNDFMELGNHAEFLGVMSRTEMLSMFFVHDGGETQKWRLKGHAEAKFWKWVCSWAVMIQKPSDIGFSDEGFDLPELIVEQITVESKASGEFLFPLEARTLPERIVARRESVDDRVTKCVDLVTSRGGKWIVWCNLNAESDKLEKLIPDAIQVKGSDTPDFKEKHLLGFSDGKFDCMVSKATIAGFGLNWQHCNQMVFVGLSDSYEQVYQAIRRCWRFGQKQPVKVYFIAAETEGSVVANIKRKEKDAEKMAQEMVKNMSDISKKELSGTVKTMDAYATNHASGEGWDLHMGDCVDVVKEIPSDSIHYTIYSPPFSSLYTYSASDRDMGNSKTEGEFIEHFNFLAKDLFRVTMPGRLMSFHCMNLPTSKVRNGFIGIRDFRGELIKLFQDCGWIFHSEVCIWKDPVIAMQRTKALGLLHKQLKKDSCMSRQGIPDYLVTMRKPGENPERVSHTNESFPVQVWQKYASPIWMDINPSKTLQYRSAREEKDERHVCPLQLEVIDRAIKLWTNPGDLVLSPFTGIGSEGHVALVNGRRFIGAELKASYWKQAKSNLTEASRMAKENDENLLFGDVEQEEPAALDVME